MWRWGWTAASASESSPRATSSSATEWSTDQLDEASGVVAVGAGVAHVHEDEPVPLAHGHEGGGDQGGAHAPQRRVVQLRFPDGPVGVRTAATRPSVVGVRVKRRWSAAMAVAAATSPPAWPPMPSATAKRVRLSRALVLVDGADPTDVGGRSRAQDGHGRPGHQRATSKTVPPTWSRSPRPRRVAASMRSAFTQVPLVEPRSSTQSVPSRRKTRAWRCRGVGVLHADPAAGGPADGDLVGRGRRRCPGSRRAR